MKIVKIIKKDADIDVSIPKNFKPSRDLGKDWFEYNLRRGKYTGDLYAEIKPFKITWEISDYYEPFDGGIGLELYGKTSGVISNDPQKQLTNLIKLSNDFKQAFKKMNPKEVWKN